MKAYRKNVPKPLKPSSIYYKLHLKLDLSGITKREYEILKKYGYVEKGITRDILINEECTLYNLHYLIQRAFGWQDKYFHNFHLLDKDFDYLVSNSFVNYMNGIGNYFRFPYPDEYKKCVYEETKYDGSYGINIWLKQRYTFPYTVRYPVGEHYYSQQYAIREWVKDNDILDYRDENGNIKYSKPIDEITFSDFKEYLNIENVELLEHLKIKELFILKKEMSEYAITFLNYNNIKYNRADELNETLIDLFDAFFVEHDRIEQAEDKKLIAERMGNAKVINNFAKKIKEQYDEINFGSPVPIVNSIIYEYDTSFEKDKKHTFKIEISLSDIYDISDDEEHTTFSLKEDYIDTEISKTWDQKIKKGLPIVLNIDGHSLFEGMNTLKKYCRFLYIVYSKKFPNEITDRLREIASNRGWSGKNKNLDNLL